jgi:hypothetical protein
MIQVMGAVERMYIGLLLELYKYQLDALDWWCELFCILAHFVYLFWQVLIEGVEASSYNCKFHLLGLSHFASHILQFGCLPHTL